MYLNSKNPNAYGNKDNGFCNFKYKTSGLHALFIYLGQDVNKDNLFNPKQYNTNDGDHLNKEKIDFNVG